MRWIRFELGRPTLGGFMAGALFAAVPAGLLGVILGSWVIAPTMVIAAVASAVGLRPGRDVL